MIHNNLKAVLLAILIANISAPGGKGPQNPNDNSSTIKIEGKNIPSTQLQQSDPSLVGSSPVVELKSDSVKTQRVGSVAQAQAIEPAATQVDSSDDSSSTDEETEVSHMDVLKYGSLSVAEWGRITDAMDGLPSGYQQAVPVAGYTRAVVDVLAGPDTTRAMLSNLINRKPE